MLMICVSPTLLLVDIDSDDMCINEIPKAPISLKDDDFCLVCPMLHVSCSSISTLNVRIHSHTEKKI